MSRILLRMVLNNFCAVGSSESNVLLRKERVGSSRVGSPIFNYDSLKILVEKFPARLRRDFSMEKKSFR